VKKFLVCALALFSSLAFGTTLNSIQLLNPAGSTAGQAILSTGPSGAPVWGAVPLTGITGTLAITNGGTGATSASVARTNLGLGTAATQNTGTSGATIPLLNGTNTWASAQTFSVRPTFNGATPYDSANLTIANYAPLASPTFTGTVTAAALQTTGLLTVSSLNGIAGTPTNNNANAGSVGEYVSSTVAQGSAVSLTNGTPANVTSISLTAGDWDVWGTVAYSPGGTTVTTNIISGISTTSATLPAVASGAYAYIPVTFSTGSAPIIPVGTTRISIASTTTVYLVAQSAFTTSTNAAYGGIYARRRR
jgi:hypothetical protein